MILNDNELSVIRLLEDKPLVSYAMLSKEIGVSPQTFSRKVSALKERGFIGDVKCSLTPEKLGLQRYYVLFYLNNYSHLLILEKAMKYHPYTGARHRFIVSSDGARIGLYCYFDIPEKAYKYFILFLERISEDYDIPYRIYKSNNRRVYHTESFFYNLYNINDYSIMDYMMKSCDHAETVSTESISKTPKLTPIHLMLLRDVTNDIRKPIANLLQQYKDYLSLPEENDSYDTLPHEYRDYLTNYFNRSSSSIRMDFYRKYQYIVSNFVYRYWLQIKRKYTERSMSFLYIIENISDEEKNRLLRIFSNNRPPFQMYADDVNSSLILIVTMPSYYHTKFAYTLSKLYDQKRIRTYVLDTYGKNSVKYRFYVYNYSIDEEEWVTSKEWVYSEPIEKLENYVKKMIINGDI